MTAGATIDQTGLRRFAQLIEEHLGLQFDGTSLRELSVIVCARLTVLGCADFKSYLRRLEATGARHQELRELAAKLTIGETYFFRSPEQFSVLTEVVLPRLARTSPGRAVRILSAGCATGEEPYTLAMTLRELDASAPAEVSILGLDLNRESIAKARRGRYSSWALRAMPPGCLEKYFRRERNQFVLDQRVKAMVRFEERNLTLEDYDFWQPHSFELIFCRNVTMYLSARALSEVVARFARVLTPDGLLFLSHAEPLRGISQAFQVEHSHGAFYYVLRAAGRTVAEVPALAPASVPREPVSITALVKPRVIPAGSRAIAAKTLRPAANEIPRYGAPAADFGGLPRTDLDGAGERLAALRLGKALMKAERFQEALATLEALPSADRNDPEVMLLTATILVECGQPEQAARLCASLLVVDDLNAAAHYLTALCHEQSGQRAAAVASYRVGVFLDRGFAMPHLRLGLMFRREGDLRSARRELHNASRLLPREDPARVLLFGGGFSRGTLINLCASELRLCEGTN